MPAIVSGGFGREVEIQVRVTRVRNVPLVIGGQARAGVREPKAAIDGDPVWLGEMCRQRFSVDKWARDDYLNRSSAVVLMWLPASRSHASSRRVRRTGYYRASAA